jgi:hypothetical protein
VLHTLHIAIILGSRPVRGRAACDQWARLSFVAGAGLLSCQGLELVMSAIVRHWADGLLVAAALRLIWKVS